MSRTRWGPIWALIESEGQAMVKLEGREFPISRSLIDDISGQPQAARRASKRANCAA